MIAVSKSILPTTLGRNVTSGASVMRSCAGTRHLTWINRLSFSALPTVRHTKPNTVWKPFFARPTNALLVSKRRPLSSSSSPQKGGGANNQNNIAGAAASKKATKDASQTTTTKTKNSSYFFQNAWQKWTAPKEIPKRYTAAWYKEMLLICTVFGITGSSSMVMVRPAVKDVLGIQGSMKDGPWSYRICSLVILSPIYGMLLVVVGTVFGRHAYFRHFSVKIFSRFGIPPELLDSSYHQTKKNFRKW